MTQSTPPAPFDPARWSAALALADALVCAPDQLDEAARPGPGHHQPPLAERVILCAVLLYTCSATFPEQSYTVAGLGKLDLITLRERLSSLRPDDLVQLVAQAQAQPGPQDPARGEWAALDQSVRTPMRPELPASPSVAGQLKDSVLALLDYHLHAAGIRPSYASTHREALLETRFAAITAPGLSERRCFPSLAGQLPHKAGASPGWTPVRRYLWERAGRYAERVATALSLAAGRLHRDGHDYSRRWVRLVQLLSYLHRAQDPLLPWPTVAQMRAWAIAEDRAPGPALRERVSTRLTELGHPLDGSAAVADEAAAAFGLIDHLVHEVHTGIASQSQPIWTWTVSCLDAILTAARGGHTAEATVALVAGDRAGQQVRITTVAWALAGESDLAPGPPAGYRVRELIREFTVPASELPPAPREIELRWEQAKLTVQRWTPEASGLTAVAEECSSTALLVALTAYLASRHSGPPCSSKSPGEWLREFGRSMEPIQVANYLLDYVQNPGWGPWQGDPHRASLTAARSDEHHDHALLAALATGLAELGHDLGDPDDPFARAWQQLAGHGIGQARLAAWALCAHTAQRSWEARVWMNQGQGPALAVAADIALGLVAFHLVQASGQTSVTDMAALQQWWPTVALLTVTLYGLAWHQRASKVTELGLPVVRAALEDVETVAHLVRVRPAPSPDRDQDIFVALPPVLEQPLIAAAADPELLAATAQQAVHVIQQALDSALVWFSPAGPAGPRLPQVSLTDADRRDAAPVRDCWIQHLDRPPVVAPDKRDEQGCEVRLA
ncbi:MULTISPECIES: hypothetical protein [unclassified Crossiella]|uniref:hypothetical protein n=1 Tax=unclassified Crossiella TaxID=2620835 RepID=UPI001FFEB937|nr:MULTISPECIES: hypothetical protein [unclassified Crossiella]MCK2245415.1 hypothetical protein [Crossiella sp. S99.2]MCK2259067.1 hypothetical protein [Crossiella sp. S99.1]